MGPELAMIGVDAPLKEGERMLGIRRIVGLQSTINEPWASGEIKVVFEGEPGFELYKGAIKYLERNGEA